MVSEMQTVKRSWWHEIYPCTVTMEGENCTLCPSLECDSMSGHADTQTHSCTYTHMKIKTWIDIIKHDNNFIEIIGQSDGMKLHWSFFSITLVQRYK